MATEEPKFTLVSQDGAFELRDYPSLVVAEVTVTGDQDQASRAGFRKLAGYIFGGNTRAQKIAMTAPVIKTRVDEGQTIAMTAPVTLIGAKDKWVVRFTMPAALGLDALPRPKDPGVTLRTLQPTCYAVIRFSGLTGEGKVAVETQNLLAATAALGLSVSGAVSLARYDPPWTPWFRRRNEVMVRIGTPGSEVA